MKTKPRTPRRTKQSRLHERTDTTLQQLVHVELVRPVPDVEPAYLFKHALVQDTAQSTLLHGEFKRLNLLVAHAYEHAYPAHSLVQFASVLAQHYLAAADDANTYKYAVLAGDQAARVYANPEAVTFYTIALESAKRVNATSAQLIPLYRKYGRAMEVMGGVNALTLYEEMTEYARARGDRVLELWSLLLRGTWQIVSTTGFDPARALALALQANALALELEDDAALAHALWNEQLLYLYNNRPVDSVRVGEQAAQLARWVDARELLGYILGDLARAYSRMGQIAASESPQRQALALWRELDNRPMVADLLMTSGVNAALRGEYGLSLRELGESVEISRSIDSKLSLVSSSWMLLRVQLERGDYENALRTLEEGTRATLEITGGNPGPLQAAFTAWVYAEIGVSDASAQAARLARTLLELPLADFYRTLAWALVARASAASDDIAAARADLAHIRVIATGEIANPGTLIGIVALGECLQAEGDYLQVIRVMSEHISTLQQAGLYQTLPEAFLLQAQAAHALGNSVQALEWMQQARAEAEAMQARHFLPQIYKLLGEWENEQGNRDRSAFYQAQARDCVAFIAGNTPPEFRAAYLNQPRVRAIADSLNTE